MSYITQNEERLRNEMAKLKNEVSLKIFTDVKIDEQGERQRKCMACERTLDTLSHLATFSDGKLQIEEISTEEDTQETDKYEIKRIPTILFLDENGKELIRFIAEPQGGLLVPFLLTLQIYSGKHSYYRDSIKGNLKNIKDSNIKVFITQTCPYCPQILPIVTEFALESNAKIKTEIIDINANPDVAAQYNIQGVPHTLINDKNHLYGLFAPQDLLEKLTKGERRDLEGMYA